MKIELSKNFFLCLLFYSILIIVFYFIHFNRSPVIFPFWTNEQTDKQTDERDGYWIQLSPEIFLQSAEPWKFPAFNWTLKVSCIQLSPESFLHSADPWKFPAFSLALKAFTQLSPERFLSCITHCIQYLRNLPIVTARNIVFQRTSILILFG